MIPDILTETYISFKVKEVNPASSRDVSLKIYAQWHSDGPTFDTSNSHDVSGRVTTEAQPGPLLVFHWRILSRCSWLQVPEGVGLSSGIPCTTFLAVFFAIFWLFCRSLSRFGQGARLWITNRAISSRRQTFTS